AAFMKSFLTDCLVTQVWTLSPRDQVLEVVAVAREPLVREQIAAATGLDPDGELVPILSRLASFVPAAARHYSFFHRSMFDWLTGWYIEEDRPFAGPYHLSLNRAKGA